MIYGAAHTGYEKIGGSSKRQRHGGQGLCLHIRRYWPIRNSSTSFTPSTPTIVGLHMIYGAAHTRYKKIGGPSKRQRHGGQGLCLRIRRYRRIRNSSTSPSTPTIVVGLQIIYGNGAAHTRYKHIGRSSKSLHPSPAFHRSCSNKFSSLSSTMQVIHRWC